LRIHNSLLALRQVAKRLEYKQEDARAPLDAIVMNALPVIQQLIVQLLQANNNTIEAALIMKLGLKILWSCSQFAMPPMTDQTVPQFSRWIEILGTIVAKNLPEAHENLEPYGQPTEPEVCCCFLPRSAMCFSCTPLLVCRSASSGLGGS
jgi:hypothetical protein